MPHRFSGQKAGLDLQQSDFLRLVISLKTNNVTRLLDNKKVSYEAFELPPEKLSAIDTAEFLNVPIHLVYKSIVLLQPNSKPILCIVPGDAQVDFKAVAGHLGIKKIRLTTQAEAESLTGLLTGGISPLALLNRGFTMILDTSSTDLEEIHVSGGERGLNIRMRVVDLVKLTNARVLDIATQLLNKNS
jgi:Cys-tRNA(Pro)/Cys-tRNA(Cys) deacylase